MRATVVRIGNSRGLRIPKALLEECGIKDAVELSVEQGRLIIEPIRTVREGWKQAAVEMAQRGEDQMLDPDASTEFDVAEWDW